MCVLFHSIMVDATISDLRKYMVPRYFTFEVLKSNFTARPSLLYSAFALTFCFRTAKTLRDKGRKIDCTRGVSREQRAINRRNILESSLVSSRSYVPERRSGNKRTWNRIIKRMREPE